MVNVVGKAVVKKSPSASIKIDQLLFQGEMNQAIGGERSSRVDLVNNGTLSAIERESTGS